MRKLIIFILSIFLFFSHAQAFLGEDLGGDMYKNLDAGFDELEQMQYSYELSGQGLGNTEHINAILKAKGFGECIDKPLGDDDVEKIKNGDIALLKTKIGENCKSDTTDSLTSLQREIQNIAKISQESAIEKSKKIFQISRIGLYSDGNIKNSGFDLISDIQDIDSIIFASKTSYEGEEGNVNTDKLLKNIVNTAKDTAKSITGNDNNNTSQNNSGTSNTDNNNQNNGNSNTDTNICIDPSKSGLSLASLAGILNEAKNGTPASNTGSQVKAASNTGAKISPKQNTNNSLFNSKQMTDVWPCYDFFCITVEFITYQHKLLGGSDNITIEYLLNRSNGHLKKFASTSLLPAKMTNNNFQLGLSNISLPDIFHLGFIITTRPVWILDTNSATSQSQFATKNLLSTFYKNKGLEYERKNDINNFKRTEPETKSVTNGGELQNNEVTSKNASYIKIISETAKANEIIEKTIEAEGMGHEFDNLNEQFTQLEGFSNSMFEYVQSINKAIKAMDEIPADKS